MFIMDRNKLHLVNMDQVTSIDLLLFGDGGNNEIYVNLVEDAPVTLGVYLTEERAKELFNKIAEIQGGTSTFYMPEE